MSNYICQYFLALGIIFDNPDAHDHHIARYLRLVKLSYEKSKTRYAPVKMSNDDLANLWKCNEPATRKCLAELKKFGWIDTRQVGQHEREIILKAVWRNDGTDSAEDINAASTRALHLEAQAPATPLPVPSKSNSIAQGDTVSSALNEGLNVVGTLNSSTSDKTIQQQDSFNSVRTGAEGATDSSTLNEDATGNSNLRSADDRDDIIQTLIGLDIETEEAFEIILGERPERYKDGYRDYSHVTLEYLQDWLIYKRTAGKGLGGGYYRLQIREKRQSPYVMSDNQRRDHRRELDEARNPVSVNDADEVVCEDEGADFSPVSNHPQTIEERIRLEKELLDHQRSKYIQDHAAELWSEAIRDLSISMPKGAFNTWLLPTQVLGWGESNELVVGCHSDGAVDVLSERLNKRVQEIVSGIKGKDVTVRYEVLDK